MRPRPAVLTAVALTTAVVLTGCASEDDADASASASDGTVSAGAGASSEGAECLADAVTQGTLTIGTDQPAYEPWFVDDDPTNGEGYESAVAYAVADRLGVARDDVEWVRVPFNAAIQPGPKDFDFDVNQFSITDERRQSVDFSSPYYDVTQTVITTGSSPAAAVTDLAGLEGLRLGAQVGTTSLTAIEEVIQPSQQPQVFNSNDDAKAALVNGQVDAIVVDLPTAFYITAAELDDGKIVGQLPAGSGETEQFGLVLDKGSPLTGCVSDAVDALRDDGTLVDLQEQWLAADGGAPQLR